MVWSIKRLPPEGGETQRGRKTLGKGPGDRYIALNSKDIGRAKAWR